MTIMILTLSVSAGLTLLSLILKVSGKLRLTLPIWYLLIAAVSTLFSDWVTLHEGLVMTGLYLLLGIVVVSWLFSLVKAIRQRKQARFAEEDILWQIRQARAQGVPLDSITFDESGSLIDPRTGQPVYYSTGR